MTTVAGGGGFKLRKQCCCSTAAGGGTFCCCFCCCSLMEDRMFAIFGGNLELREGATGELLGEEEDDVEEDKEDTLPVEEERFTWRGSCCGGS